MRSEDQIKRKLHELSRQRDLLVSRMPADQSAGNPQVDRIEDMILMLEWVLDQPSGSYHV
ncbi:hypothetical protein [Paenibacillus sp. Marseille-Q4541]|uniref:hypothetical protein n=1 Tax=Paenibacillus sp. Marseille-Q4541 TaxID=2831522 RepID=UPI001BA7FAF7|nr:hypothetical protein [Paenibacillus sp. Marseille-Q4541]